MPTIRRLGSGDEAIVVLLATDEPDFGLTDDGPPRATLPDAAIYKYLADLSVVHWIAEENGEVLGHLHCQLIRKHVGAAQELLIYDIGVRAANRRRGIGKALIQTMYDWMDKNSISEVWVLSDGPGAEEFYAACSFAQADEQPTYMTHER